jgi:hypothetical protein
MLGPGPNKYLFGGFKADNVFAAGISCAVLILIV